MKQKLSSFTIIIIFSCFSFIGVALIPLLTIQLQSTRNIPELNVSFSWPDASAKVLEQEVTSKLEGLLNELPNVQWIRSNSAKGRGSINMGFKPAVDLDIMRYEVANSIRQVYPKLPDGVSYPDISMRSPTENNRPILTYSINAGESPYYIDKYASAYLVPELSTMKGINSVRLYGATPYQYVITYNTAKLIQLQLSVREVKNAINSYFFKNDLGKGTTRLENKSSKQEIPIQLVFTSDIHLDWNTIPIKKINDRIIYFKDIASIKFKEGSVTSYYRINGLNTVNMVIYPEKGVNTIALTKKVRAKVTRLKSKLKMGYYVKLTRDSSEFLVKELNKIQKRTLFSLIILLILTVLIFRNVRYIGILFISIFCNLLIAVIFYYVLDIQLQLYSFAGMTISFGIIIDNSIIMLDHIVHKKNKKAFLAILAATLTTISAVMVIYFLKESQQNNLLDFAYVIVINLFVSLLVSYFFVPALLEKFNLQKKDKKVSTKRKIRILNFIKGYHRSIRFIRRPIFYRILVLLLILSFGIPVYLLPKKIKNAENAVSTFYNQTVGSDTFSNSYRPVIETILGGSLKLFAEDVFEQSYYAEPKQTVLQVSGVMPEGGSIEQLNTAIQKMENYLLTFDEIKLFETEIRSYQNSMILIYFKETYEFGAFPYILKSLIESKAISLGGLDWTIYGVGKGFSNKMGNSNGQHRIELEGYNYDNLYTYATSLQQRLIRESNGRVKKVRITSGRWQDNSKAEFYLKFNPELLALQKITINELYNALLLQLYSGSLSRVLYKGAYQQVKLISDQAASFNVWDLKNTPITIGEREYKLNQLATIEKRNTGNEIRKENQQYHLVVNYDFLGNNQLASQFQKGFVEKFEKLLPIGYKIYSKGYGNWNRGEKTQYLYIFIIILTIFFICAIALESLLQPLAIIAMIPISFIGVFLTFYLFEFNFDQGGYASFILLSGISVNSALYILNDFNNLLKLNPDRNSYTLYFKAFRYKIIPVLLTIITTIAGLLPFIQDGQNEVFWFSFAVGSIGGLLFSLIGIVIYLPLFTLKYSNR